MAESFVFYGTWEEQLECLDPATRVQFLEAIINYGLHEEEPDFTGLAQALWIGIKNDMDNAKARRIKNIENGKLGGRPETPQEIQEGICEDLENGLMQKEIAEKRGVSQQTVSNIKSKVFATKYQKPTPNTKNLDVDVDVDVDGNVDVKGNSGTIAPQAPPKRRFVKPTVDEIRAYCAERKNNIDAQYFWDYYEARGWKAGGRSAMKDWRAAVRTWEKNNFQTSPLKNQGMDGDQSQQSKARALVESWKTGVYV